MTTEKDPLDLRKEWIDQKLDDANRKLAIKKACSAYNYKWPKDLYTGVMFYAGYRIEREEFNEWARRMR